MQNKRKIQHNKVEFLNFTEMRILNYRKFNLKIHKKMSKTLWILSYASYYVIFI